MTFALSREAAELLEAGIRETQECNDAEKIADPSFGPLDDAVAELCSRHTPLGNEVTIEKLKEIAKAHILHLVQHRQAAE